MTKIAIFPGSFDPFTKGHQDIVDRALKLFDQIIIAVGHNPKKSTRYFEISSSIRAIKKTFENNPKVKVITYNQLTAGLAKDNEANYILRGVRNTTDFEYENSISQVNRILGDDRTFNIETIFLITSPNVAWISSSIVRELHKYKEDITKLVPFDPSKFNDLL